MIIKGCVSAFVTLIYCKSRIYVFAPAFRSVLLLLWEVQINKKLCSTIRYSCIRDPNCTCSFFFILLVPFGIGGTLHQYNPFRWKWYISRAQIWLLFWKWGTCCIDGDGDIDISYYMSPINTSTHKLYRDDLEFITYSFLHSPFSILLFSFSSIFILILNNAC